MNGRTLALLITLTGLGCSSNDASPVAAGSAGAPGGKADLAQLEIMGEVLSALHARAEIHCAKRETCEPWSLRVTDGTKEACVLEKYTELKVIAEMPGMRITQELADAFLACNEGMKAINCRDFSSVYTEPVSCHWHNGTLAEGDACSDDAQCAVGLGCKKDWKATDEGIYDSVEPVDCGKCAPALELGAACDFAVPDDFQSGDVWEGPGSCGVQARCNLATDEPTCEALKDPTPSPATAQLGADCEKDADCAQSTTFVARCLPDSEQKLHCQNTREYFKAGSPCIDWNCDLRNGIDCNTDTMLCEVDVDPNVESGQDCGIIQDGEDLNQRECKPGLFCNIPRDANGERLGLGKCVPLAEEGAACDPLLRWSQGPECKVGLECVADQAGLGVCKIASGKTTCL